MPSSGRASRWPSRSVTLWAVATSLVTALVVAGCAGSVTADEASLLADATGSPEPTISAGSDLAAKAAPSEASADADASGEDGDSLVTSSPDSRSPVGSLAPGFPVDLLPMPDDAVLLVTSAVSVGDAGVQEISLNLQTSWPTARILTLYRESLVAAGFVEVPAIDTALSAESTFTRSDGDEIVSVGVLDSEDGRTVTIGGRVDDAD